MPDPNSAGWDAAGKAQKTAAQTPSLVRKAMLAAPQTVCGITLHPLSLDHLWTLEAITHPMGSPGAADSTELTPLHIAQLIYTFAQPGEAVQLCAQAGDPESRLTPFDLAAFAFVRHAVPDLGDLTKIAAAIVAMLTGGLATAPGAGSENPTGPAA